MGNGKRRIDAVYAFVMEDEQGEGIPRVKGPDGREHVLIDSREQLVREFIPTMLTLNRPFRVLRFGGREDVTDRYVEGFPPLAGEPTTASAAMLIDLDKALEDESDRQMTLMALAHLSVERPGWREACRDVATRIGGAPAAEAFDLFREMRAGGGN
jgi:hypothetical protein